MRWRTDIAAMLRARRLVLALWTTLLAAVVTAMLWTGWWSAPRDATVQPIVVRSAATEALQEELELVSADAPWSFIDTQDSPSPTNDGVPDIADGDTLPIYDNGRQELRAAMHAAPTSCETKLPYAATVTRTGTLATDLDIRILEASRSDLIDTGYSWEDDKQAPDGTTYVQLLVTADNNAERSTFPSLSLAIVSERAQVYREVFESTMDNLGSAMPGEQVTGVVLFRLPAVVAESAKLYALVSADIYSTAQVAEGIEAGTCVALAPTQVAAVGASDRVEERRLVEP